MSDEHAARGADDERTANGTDDEQQREARRSRDTGGDAPAAGSIEEREAVAEDRDDEFDDD